VAEIVTAGLAWSGDSLSLGLYHLGDDECCKGGRMEVEATLEWEFHHVYNLGALWNKYEL